MPHSETSSPILTQARQLADPLGVSTTFFNAWCAWMAHPPQVGMAMAALWRQLGAATQCASIAACTLSGSPSLGKSEDRRFADPEWRTLAPYVALKEYYIGYARWLEDVLLHTPELTPDAQRRLVFWARQWLNAFAPTNFLFTNPVALRKCWDSRGESLLAGVKLWLEDVRAGDVQMVERSAFEVGRNLAITSGSVVYRNELIELIQYAPATRRVYRVPIVVIPPWINKYYIVDLDRDKSLVRWLVHEGFTVFVVSWKNPTRAHANTTFDDYLMKGARAAIAVANAICKVNQAHAVGYCIGGTALAALMAWFNGERGHRRLMPVSSWTLLATLVDFSRPGPIEAFISEDIVAAIDELMARTGYLDGRSMEQAFRMLRSNSLIWHYVVHKYLYGETPPPFDILYWNTDGTRMPRAMHRFCLTEFYLRNQLVRKNALKVAGRALDLGAIRQPLYAVGCVDDHIAPWKATWEITRRLPDGARYTLSSSGHILGIINPPAAPGTKHRYWTGPAPGGDPDEWLAHREPVAGSWWEDWSAWLAEHCGPLVAARKPGSPAYPSLGPAPGTYVHEM